MNHIHIEKLKLIADMHKRSMESGLVVFWMKLMQRGYLLVPERHKDGAWHMHGLLSGLPAEHLSDFIEGIHPIRLVKSGFKNWSAYERKFGFFSAGEIRNKEACIFYLLKYITKDLAKNAVELNNRMVFASQGLKKGEYVFKNNFVELEDDFTFDHVNEWCRTKNFNFIGDLDSWSDVVTFSDGSCITGDGIVLDWDDVMKELEGFKEVEEHVRVYYGEQLRMEC